MDEQQKAPSEVSSRFGVDIGGTFTDFVYFDGATRQTRVAKVPTTAAAPDQACIEAAMSALSDSEIHGAAHFVHGTTVGLNALIQRNGAKVGLLVTEGFRDVLEIARADRLNPFSLRAERVRPLIPRSLSLTARGRMNYKGEELQPLERADLEAALATFREQGVNAIAVCFIHAYANPAHELAAFDILRESGFDGPITLSHQVSGEHREYERASTAVIDAFVRSVMLDYLTNLDRKLRDLGFSGTSLVVRSGGGSMSFSEAHPRTFETIMSGPAAGAQGAAEIARKLGIATAITADVGGTSFDTCLVNDGRPAMLYEGNIEGMPVQAPWVDIRSIGAGGGSIAHVDPGGLLRVGPESAGARPGPACYNRGGTRPTLTDAECLLGMFGDGKLASGLVLRKDLAETAVRSVAEKIGYTPAEAARGIVVLAVTAMANAIREITVGKGIDPRTGSIMAFGGAGPLISDMLARELQIRQVVIPPHAGNFSAWGMLGADIVRSASRTRVIRAHDDAIPALNATIAELDAEIGQRGQSIEGTREVCLDMRYAGQEHTVSVVFELDGDTVRLGAAEMIRMFRKEFESVYKTSWAADVEIVSTRLLVRQSLPVRNEILTPATGPVPTRSTCRAFSFALNGEQDFTLVDRASIRAREKIAGPAIVSEPTTTTYVDAGSVLELHETGSLIITIGEQG